MEISFLAATKYSLLVLTHGRGHILDRVFFICEFFRGGFREVPPRLIAVKAEDNIFHLRVLL